MRSLYCEFCLFSLTAPEVTSLYAANYWVILPEIGDQVGKIPCAVTRCGIKDTLPIEHILAMECGLVPLGTGAIQSSNICPLDLLNHQTRIKAHCLFFWMIRGIHVKYEIAYTICHKHIGDGFQGL